MDTSASDVSLADFNDSYNVPRKRKKKIAPPLKFQEEPLDLRFDSPDRPRAVANPRGAPCVDAYNNTYNWISPDKFEVKVPQVHNNNRTVRQSLRQVVPKSCDQRGCQNIHHKHHISVSSNDSDLLLYVEERDNPTNHGSPSTPHDDNSPITARAYVSQLHDTNPPISALPQSHMTITHQSEPVTNGGLELKNTSTPVRSLSSSIDLITVTKLYQVTPSKSSVSTSPVSPSPVSPSPVSPSPNSPLKCVQKFRTVGYSQCKSEHKIKKTRHPRNKQNIPINQDKVPESPVILASKLTRNQIPESPVLPASKYRRLSTNTPKAKGILLAENTPEHLTGLRMVSRRLREVLGDPVCDSQR